MHLFAPPHRVTSIIIYGRCVWCELYWPRRAARLTITAMGLQFAAHCVRRNSRQRSAQRSTRTRSFVVHSIRTYILDEKRRKVAISHVMTTLKLCSTVYSIRFSLCGAECMSLAFGLCDRAPPAQYLLEDARLLFSSIVANCAHTESAGLL